MHRVLRVFVFAQVLTCAIFAVIFYVITHQRLPYQTISTLVVLMMGIAPTGFSLGVVAAVVVSVACFQQRRWGWAVVLVVLVVLVILALYFSVLLYFGFLWLGGSSFVASFGGITDRAVYQ